MFRVGDLIQHRSNGPISRVILVYPNGRLRVKRGGREYDITRPEHFKILRLVQTGNEARAGEIRQNSDLGMPGMQAVS